MDGAIQHKHSKMNDVPHHFIYAANVGGIFAIIASSAGYLPPIAAFVASSLAAAVYGIQLYDRLKNGRNH